MCYFYINSVLLHHRLPYIIGAAEPLNFLEGREAADMNENEDDNLDSEETPFNSEYETPEESGNSDSGSGSLWDNPNSFDALKMEKELHPEEDEVAMAKRFFTEAMPQVAQKMVNLALYAANDNTALAAGKYITDLVILDQSGSSKAKWEELLGDAISEVELHANEG
jgi:hypothetical protein